MEPQEILTAAIEQYEPVALIALYSGGYDSAVTTHLLHTLDTYGLPIQVWAIDTKLAADGWHEYVTGVAKGQGWNFNIYDNQRGFYEYLKWIFVNGNPRTLAMHSRAFHRLKERGFNALLKMNKITYYDKVLFVSGRRRAESENRARIPAIERIGDSNKIFAAPIVEWTNEQTDLYRIENNLPDNPFYDTVKGSGDCQCNWGRFITYRMLQKHSPKLAAGNVAIINETSKELHGYGWDGMPANQTEMFGDFEDTSELTSPFLCAGCSRAKVRVPAEAVEYRILQAGF